MKPGSSDRCKSKFNGLRCHLRKGHERPHQAPRRYETVYWHDGESVAL